MSDVQQIISQTSTSGEDSNSQASSSSNATSTNTAGKEKNYTDPKVCHDPTVMVEGIARFYTSQNKFMMEDGEDISAANNVHDATLLDGIEYPLIVINNRNIENDEIYNMIIDYNSFLPKLHLEIQDRHQAEQKINTTQMSGLIRVCMISSVDKVYKKILLNFKITNVTIDENDPTYVTYSGEYYVEGFRQTNISHIWMESVCSSSQNCQQGGHVNANTWEMLHKISELTGLGFAATKQCKEISDHVLRNISYQRYDKFIEQQLLHSGLGDSNIFDAWVDLYGYIVMVNVKWVMDEELMPSDLTIIHNTGIHATSNNLMDQNPEETERTLSNYNYMGVKSNAEISSYHLEVNNDSVEHGTLERIYKINIGGTKVSFDEMDIQTKQDSIDGEFIEDYNTGKNRPIPRFNFNDSNYTGIPGGYNLDEQKKIRAAWFKKKRQSLLTVDLKTPNFGLQRGTLVNIAIFEDDPVNKQITMENSSNLHRDDSDVEADNIALTDGVNKSDIIMEGNALVPNVKLTGLYYIDGMRWEYKREYGRIIQSIILIKKGITSGYHNKHNAVKMHILPKQTTLEQSPQILDEENVT